MIVLPSCFNAGDTIYCFFDSYDSSGGSVTITGLAVTDIEIYKNGSTTQRASDNGYALLDTDGIDFDGVTGLHGFSIDTSDNSDAGFWADGNQYLINVNSVTIDGQTVRFSYLLALGYSLRPTTKGRQLDVSSGGEAGIDFANIGSPTTTVNLSGTTVAAVTEKTGFSLASTGLDAVTIAEPGGAPEFGTSSVRQAIAALIARFFNKSSVTRSSSTTGTLAVRNVADNANLWTQALTDDGTTSTAGKGT